MLWSVSDPMSHAEVLLFSPSICPQKGYVVMSLSLSSYSVGQQTSIDDITPVSLPFLHPSIWQHGGLYTHSVPASTCLPLTVGRHSAPEA